MGAPILSQQLNMKRQRPNTNYEKGTVLVYVFLGIALFAALSYVISRNLDAPTQAVSEDQTSIRADRILNYVNQMRGVLQQLKFSGVPVTDLNFVMRDDRFQNPGGTDFATSPHFTKVFHPGGGGLSEISLDNSYKDPAAANPVQIALQFGTNVEWTPTAGTDVLLTVINLHADICRTINDRLYGSGNITPNPPVTTISPQNVFVNTTSGANDDFEAADCAECDGRVALCVQDDTSYTFYTVVAAQ